MKLFDFHCDTPFALETHGEELTNNNRHVSLSKARDYESYGQVMAIWSQKSLQDEEAWARFFTIRKDFLSKQPEGKTAICTTFSDYREAVRTGKRPFFFAVEDARILNGDLDRLTTLYEHGVRLLTLVWRDETCIGGAYNTEIGLSDFGRDVVARCFALGIVPDLSHASDAMTREVLDLAARAGKPVIATHSNSRTVCDHKRNLTDETAREIASLGGVFGINMVPFHLAEDSVANVGTVCRHILHFLELGLGDAVAMGCDLDGMDETPEGIRHVGDLPRIAEALSAHGVSDEQIERVFCRNAERILARCF